MVLGIQLIIFLSLAVVLAITFVALLCDFLKGNNEQLQQRNIELRVRQDERDRLGLSQPLAWLQGLAALARQPQAAEAFASSFGTDAPAQPAPPRPQPAPAARAAEPPVQESPAPTVETDIAVPAGESEVPASMTARKRYDDMKATTRATSWASKEELEQLAGRAARIRARHEASQQEAPKPPATPEPVIADQPPVQTVPAGALPFLATSASRLAEVKPIRETAPPAAAPEPELESEEIAFSEESEWEFSVEGHEVPESAATEPPSFDSVDLPEPSGRDLPEMDAAADLAPAMQSEPAKEQTAEDNPAWRFTPTDPPDAAGVAVSQPQSEPEPLIADLAPVQGESAGLDGQEIGPDPMVQSPVVQSEHGPNQEAGQPASLDVEDPHFAPALFEEESLEAEAFATEALEPESIVEIDEPADLEPEPVSQSIGEESAPARSSLPDLATSQIIARGTVDTDTLSPGLDFRKRPEPARPEQPELVSLISDLVDTETPVSAAPPDRHKLAGTEASPESRRDATEEDGSFQDIASEILSAYPSPAPAEAPAAGQAGTDPSAAPPPIPDLAGGGAREIPDAGEFHFDLDEELNRAAAEAAARADQDSGSEWSWSPSEPDPAATEPSFFEAANFDLSFDRESREPSRAAEGEPSVLRRDAAQDQRDAASNQMDVAALLASAGSASFDRGNVPVPPDFGASQQFESSPQGWLDEETQPAASSRDPRDRQDLEMRAVDIGEPEPPAVHVPAGLHPAEALGQLIESQHEFRGVAVAVGINDYDNLKDKLAASASSDSLAALNRMIASMLGPQDFAARFTDDEFILLYPGESGSAAQRRLFQVSEKLWDFQLRSLGSLSIMFSWGGLEVNGETFADSVTAARERMYQTRRSRKNSQLELGITRRRVVNG
ncbi:MAG: diguanylate cyclase [Bryobacteraceae bacterium]